MITICEWPDGTWCELEDVIYYLSWMSDDFETKQITEEQFEQRYN